MKTITLLFLGMFFLSTVSTAQQTAMDFTMNDCNGQMHNLFSTLDEGKVVIQEFFMTCNSCITAGHQLEDMKAKLDAQFPGMIEFYQIAFTNSYSCTTVMNWVNDNGFSSVPFDSGSALVAYYGGFGMPTVAVVGGASHEVLFTGIGWATGDTAAIATAINEFLNTTGINEVESSSSALNIYPNPATDKFTLELNLTKGADVKMELLTMNGKTLSVLANEKMNAGQIQRTFENESLPSGFYLVKATINGNSSFTKLQITH